MRGDPPLPSPAGNLASFEGSPEEAGVALLCFLIEVFHAKNYRVVAHRRGRGAGRERGAELAEKAAVATEKVTEAAHEAALTTKIKAKMALDDSVKARTIDVSTDGSTVTLSGTVGSVAEHDRALALAKETDGVSSVIDRLKVHPQ